MLEPRQRFKIDLAYFNSGHDPEKLFVSLYSLQYHSYASV